MPLTSEDRRLRRERTAEHVAYAQELFRQMRSDALSMIEQGVDAPAAELLPRLRWDPRLTEAIYLPSYATATLFGARTAATLGTTFTVEKMLAHLMNHATTAARNINRRLLERLDLAMGDDEDPVAASRAMFDNTIGPRSERYGQTIMTTTVGVASLQAAAQGERRVKVWENNSGNPRPEHDISGERAQIDSTFSNGLAYPGDPVGGPALSANCNCTMSYE